MIIGSQGLNLWECI